MRVFLIWYVVFLESNEIFLLKLRNTQAWKWWRKERRWRTFHFLLLVSRAGRAGWERERPIPWAGDSCSVQPELENNIAAMLPVTETETGQCLTSGLTRQIEILPLAVVSRVVILQHLAHNKAGWARTCPDRCHHWWLIPPPGTSRMMTPY